ncbi:MAG: hypothetical protein R3275_04650 [Saprospiraceae bacterium]|nr:hypothetical protein [Saprospiraceae bacterium]
MKNLAALFFTLCFVPALMNAQSDETLFNHNGIKLTGIWAGNTSNINEDNDDYGVFHGGFVFAEFNKSFTFGWQGYGLNDQGLEMDFNGIHIGYAHESFRVLHPTFTMFAGRGEFETQDELELEDNVFALQPSLGLEMNIVKWFRLGLDVGYRFVFDSDLVGYSDTDVSEPYVGLRLKFGYSWGD